MRKSNILFLFLNTLRKTREVGIYTQIQQQMQRAALESVTITAAMVLPFLILQKPHRSSKAKEHVNCNERCMRLWQEGKLDDLLKERQTIQQHLQHSTHDRFSEEQLARSFDGGQSSSSLSPDHKTRR